MDFRVQVDGPHCLTMTWKSPSNTNGPIIGYKVGLLIQVHHAFTDRISNTIVLQPFIWIQLFYFHVYQSE